MKNNDRETVIINDNKQRIQNIKAKYNNMQMSDKAAKKIISLEGTSKLLKLATTGVGIITIIDFIVPDPVLGLDEVALASITGVLGYASSLVNNKINDLASNGETTMQMDEITGLTEQIGTAASAVKKSRNK